MRKWQDLASRRGRIPTLARWKTTQYGWVACGWQRLLTPFKCHSDDNTHFLNCGHHLFMYTAQYTLSICAKIFTKTVVCCLCVLAPSNYFHKHQWARSALVITRYHLYWLQMSTTVKAENFISSFLHATFESYIRPNKSKWRHKPEFFILLDSNKQSPSH